MTDMAASDDEAQPVDTAGLARTVQWAGLIVDAALPLAGVQAEPDEGTYISLPDRVADRIALRTEAFRQVLREMTRYETTIRPDEAGDLAEGRMPQGPPSRKQADA
jgi:hypothetical protein